MTYGQYHVNQEEKIFSPALIYYRDLIDANMKETIRIAGGTKRLWPHVKSHKMKKMILLQMEKGITRFKCATLEEMRMVAECGAEHILLAYPLVGPNIAACVSLVQEFPGQQFYVLADDMNSLLELDREVAARGVKLGYFADVNMGMNRTGIEVALLYDFMVTAAQKVRALHFGGFHCYDGHVHTADLSQRTEVVSGAMSEIASIIDSLRDVGISVPAIIAGGSVTFPCHAQSPEIFLSPGTAFLWDGGYGRSYPEMQYIPAAAVLTRVISHPTKGMFTLDLGYKGIASDQPGIRGTIVGLSNAEPAFQSEEHWVWQMLPGYEEERPAIGTVCYVIPTHICPTSALYSSVPVVSDGDVVERWTVDARR